LDGKKSCNTSKRGKDPLSWNMSIKHSLFDKMDWEKKDFVEVVCPDGFVTYRLSRIRKT
jgi:hypothetical protein